MKHSIKVGFSFGVTSGIITTLGLVVGLSASTHSKFVVLGAIIAVAIADTFADAFGVHISEESENRHTPREIWESTVCTFLSKFVFAMTFVIPITLLPLTTAIIVSVVWGLSSLGLLSFYIAKEQRTRPWKAIVEHLVIALVVIALTHYVGGWIGSTFR